MSDPASHAFSTLHVTDYAAPYEGAFIRQLRMLDEEIRSRGGRASGIALTPAALEMPWVEVLERDGWHVHEVPHGSTRAQRHVADRIVDAVHAQEPDVVHVHFGTFDLSARLALRELRRELEHDERPPRLVWHYRTALETTVAERSAVRRAKDYLKFDRGGRDVDLVAAVTRALAVEAIGRGAPADRTRGVVAGCDTDRFRADARSRADVRAELGVADDDVVLLHMGWSWHRKGGDLLAEAMERIELDRRRRGAHRAQPDVVAFSIGAPDEVRLGSVRALPMREDVHRLHQAADIFVSASRSEGFGNGLVEAMACERVAIAACADGQRETFAGIAGVAPVAIDDSGAIAEAVSSLVARRSEWAVLGVANRAHVLERHSMRRWARDMAGEYADLAPGRLTSVDGGEAAPAAAQEVA